MIAPAGQPVKSAPVDIQTVLAPENTVLGSWTVIWAQLLAVFVPSVADNATVYTPGVSNTCAATGPVAKLRLPFALPLAQFVPPGSAANAVWFSPKFHRYSRSWNERVVAVAVVAVASKNTDNGATPVVRLGTFESAMAPPVAEHPVLGGGGGVTA